MFLCRKKYLKSLYERLIIKNILCESPFCEKIRYKIVTLCCHFTEYTYTILSCFTCFLVYKFLLLQINVN